jgi:hypothetical protein
MPRTYVFGAGASKHAGYPLASELSGALVNYARLSVEPDCEWGHWLSRDQLQSLLSPVKDFEALITELEEAPPRPCWKKVTVYPKVILAGLTSALCNYFDSIRHQEAPLYCRFARQIVNRDEIISSFNYDTALERELRLAGNWEMSDGYGFSVYLYSSLGLPTIPESPVQVLKLHGSTNWIDLVCSGIEGHHKIVNFLGPRPVILPQEVEYLDYLGYRDSEFNGGSTERSGSLILPSLQKRYFTPTSIDPSERRPFWTALWDNAHHALRTADEIIIVGYSLPLADARARQLILESSNRKARIVICCGSDSNRICGEFKSQGFVDVHSGDSFERLIEDRRLLQAH